MTHPIDPRRIEVLDEAVAVMLRTKTPAERVAMAAHANQTMRLLIEGHLRTQHPEWSNTQIAAEVVRRMTRGSA